MPATPSQTQQISVFMADISARVSVIEQTVHRIDVCLYGNGKPGLSDDFKRLEVMMVDHIKSQEIERVRIAEETKAAKDLLASEAAAARDLLAKQVQEEKAKKEKISSRTWAVALIIITAFVSVIAGQVVIYMQLLRTP